MKLLKLILLTALSISAVFAAEKNKPDKVVVIQVVAYARSDVTKAENRLFILGDTAYRNLDELKQAIPAFSENPEVHLMLYETDISPAPRLTSKEIDELAAACSKAGVHFTYRPGG
jgi:hypothetical protein